MTTRSTTSDFARRYQRNVEQERLLQSDEMYSNATAVTAPLHLCGDTKNCLSACVAALCKCLWECVYICECMLHLGHSAWMTLFSQPFGPVKKKKKIAYIHHYKQWHFL